MAPKKEDFPSYDWSADVAKLKGPVMLVFADSDMYKYEHIVKFYQMLGGGQKAESVNASDRPRAFGTTMLAMSATLEYPRNAIEVADTTLRFDLLTKVPLYARWAKACLARPRRRP